MTAFQSSVYCLLQKLLHRRNRSRRAHFKKKTGIFNSRTPLMDLAQKVHVTMMLWTDGASGDSPTPLTL